jgi:hypothetical protein
LGGERLQQARAQQGCAKQGEKAVRGHGNGFGLKEWQYKPYRPNK